MKTAEPNQRDENLEKIRKKAEEMGMFLNDTQTLEIWEYFGDQPASYADIEKRIKCLEDDGWEIPDDREMD